MSDADAEALAMFHATRASRARANAAVMCSDLEDYEFDNAEVCECPLRLKHGRCGLCNETWLERQSGLNRQDDARYHAGEWACGVPGFGQICHGNAKAASYYHRVAIWLGWAWGCAGIWSECDSGLERPDTVEYHAGWFQPLPYGQKRNLRDVHHRTWYGERQAMGCGYPWGCRSWDDVNESGLEREDSIDYHVGFGCDVKALRGILLDLNSEDDLGGCVDAYARSNMFDDANRWSALWGCADAEPWEF